MSKSKKIYVLICLLLLFWFTNAFSQSTSGTEIANIQSWLNHEGQKYYKPGTGDQWVRNSSPNGDRYIKVESPVNYKASNGRNYPVVIEKTGQIDGSKIGKAMVKLAKSAAPISLGIAVYDVICELSNICKKDGLDEWGYQQPGSYDEEYPSCEEAIGWTHPSEYTECVNIRNNSVNVGKRLYWFRSPAPSIVQANCYLAGVAGFAYATAGYRDCVDAPTEGTTRTPTENDWLTAEDLLNDPRFDEPLLVNGQPVPLANLPVFGNVPPITLSDTETINRDSNGNVTGTTRTTTTLTLTDSATETRPGSVTGTEITIKTDYDISGQPTGTQTSTANPPPPDKPAEPTTISFDEVPDEEIEKQEVDFDFDYENWGEGVCPAPIPISTSFNTFTIPTEPICDFATGARPIILIFSGLASMFIIAGVRNAS